MAAAGDIDWSELRAVARQHLASVALILDACDEEDPVELRQHAEDVREAASYMLAHAQRS